MNQMIKGLLAASVVLSLATPALAADNAPIQGIAPQNGIADAPLAPLTQQQRDNLLKQDLKEHEKAAKEAQKEASRSTGDVSPDHFSFTTHFHAVDNIYNRYDGYIDRGEVASGYNGKNSQDTLGFTITRTVSNGWSTSIGFSDSVVSSSVGYNVNYSESKSWSYSSVVNPFKTVHIGYQDWYHVQEFNCHTDWYDNSTGYYIGTDNGTGWAQQWYKPNFYSWET